MEEVGMIYLFHLQSWPPRYDHREHPTRKLQFHPSTNKGAEILLPSHPVSILFITSPPTSMISGSYSATLYAKEMEVPEKYEAKMLASNSQVVCPIKPQYRTHDSAFDSAASPALSLPTMWQPMTKASSYKLCYSKIHFPGCPLQHVV